MLQYFQPIVHYIHENPHIGALIAFLIALAESLPLVGTIVPGSVTMTAIGTLIGTGVLPGFSTLLWASFGALVGDTIGFGSGYLFTEKIRNIWPFKKYPHWLELSEKFFEKHGGKSIIIGRFVGPARSTVPLVAGLLKMAWLRFILAAIPSAIMWAILYMVPGILIGALAVELPPHIATEFLLIGIIVVVFLWLIFWAIQYFFGQLAHMINVMIDKLWDILIRHKPSRPFIRLIAVKGKPLDHYQLTLTLLFLLASLLFLFTFYSVAQSSWLTGINVPFFNLMQSLRTKHLDQFFILVTLFGKTYVMFSAIVLASIGLAFVRQWRAAVHLFILAILMSGVIFFFKSIYHNPRPEGFQFISSSSSFPSGHSGITFITLSALAYFSGKIVKPTAKWVLYTIASVLIALVTVSRLYLGAHWLTDILGSITLGFAILFAVIINYRRRDRKQFQKINKTYWFTLIILSLLVPWIIWTDKNYRFATYRYQPAYSIVTMSISQWWNDPTKYLPIYRLNRFGEPIQPFNLEWAGNLSQIQSKLEKSGWTSLDLKYSVKGTLKRFTNNKQYHLPLLPWLYHHHPPRLILLKHSTDKKRIIEVRLWQAAAKLSDEKYPIWVGTINYHIPPPSKIRISHFKNITLQESGGISQLISILKKSTLYQYKLIHIPHHHQPPKVQLLQWDGHIIIIRTQIKNRGTRSL